MANKHYNVGSNNPRFKKEGSKRIESGEYIGIKIGNKYVAEHRYKVEKYLGFKLKKGWLVHHIDGNGLNNLLKNLYIFMNRGRHSGFENLVKDNIISKYSIISNLKEIKRKYNEK
jgi:hypothetical protein